jgi:hypothetical protein
MRADSAGGKVMHAKVDCAGRVMYRNDLTLLHMKPIFTGLAVEGYRWVSFAPSGKADER